MGAAGLLAVRAPATAESAPDGRMQLRAIPASGERLPVIGMGTSGTFDAGESPTERAPLVEVTRLLLQTSNSLIDTAPSYGRAEAVVGDILQGGGWRERAFVATKISARAGEDARAQWARSLARLRTDKVDLLQVPQPGRLAAEPGLPARTQGRGQGALRRHHPLRRQRARHAGADRAGGETRFRADQLLGHLRVIRRAAALLPLPRSRGGGLINRAFEDGRLFGTA